MSSVSIIFGITVVYTWSNTDRNAVAVDRNIQVLSQDGTLPNRGGVARRKEPRNSTVSRPEGANLSQCSAECLHPSWGKLESGGARPTACNPCLVQRAAFLWENS